MLLGLCAYSNTFEVPFQFDGMGEAILGVRQHLKGLLDVACFPARVAASRSELLHHLRCLHSM